MEDVSGMTTQQQNLIDVDMAGIFPQRPKTSPPTHDADLVFVNCNSYYNNRRRPISAMGPIDQRKQPETATTIKYARAKV